MRNRIAFLLCSAVAAAGAAADDKDQISTDRPDFVESSIVVGKGRFQVETSIAGERNKADGIRERTITTPTLLRFGIADTLELRVETDGRTSYRADGGGLPAVREQGYSDTAVGVKWHVLDAAGARPSIGLLFHVDLDSGSGPFRGDGKRPSLRLSTEWELPNDFSLGIMSGAVWERNAAAARYAAGVFGASLGKAWTERFRTYVELAAPHIASGANGGSTLSFDFGGAYLLADRWQVDTGLVRGLNRNTADLGWTVGLSTKF